MYTFSYIYFIQSDFVMLIIFTNEFGNHWKYAIGYEMERLMTVNLIKNEITKTYSNKCSFKYILRKSDGKVHT